MISQITKEASLKDHLIYKIEDAGISIYAEKGLRHGLYAPLKVDDYYNSLKMGGKTPKSVDFVIPVDCECDNYYLYIVELKNYKSPKELVRSDIEEKFENTINDFLHLRYGRIFELDKYKYKGIKLLLVTSAYKGSSEYDSFKDYYDTMTKKYAGKSIDLDYRLSERLFCFRGKVGMIEKEIPNRVIIKRYL